MKMQKLGWFLCLVLVPAGCAGVPRGESDFEEAASYEAEGVAAPVWEEAKARGVDFRALGQEPGWSIEIDHEGEILFVGDYGEWRVTLPAVEPRVSEDGDAIYEVESEEHALRVLIWKIPCSDAMSGAPYDYTVVVIIDGSEFRGCGKYL